MQGRESRRSWSDGAVASEHNPKIGAWFAPWAGPRVGTAFRKTSCSNKQPDSARCFEEPVPAILVAVFRGRRWRRRLAGTGWGLEHGNSRLQRLLHGCLIGRFRQLHRPRRLVARINFEEAGAVVTAREAVLGAPNREFLFPRAHEGLTGPF